MPQLVTLYRVVTYTNECPHTWQRATALIADHAAACRYLKHLQKAYPRVGRRAIVRARVRP